MPPPSASFSPGRLGEVIGEEIDRLKEFIELLQREQTLLVQGDTEGLLLLIENKNRMANALAVLAKARENELGHLGLPADRAGMEAWLARFGQDDQRRSWRTLLELAVTARDLNVANGKLIGMHMQHNQQAFNALMGAADQAMTYGPDGQQLAGLGRRSFGSV